MCLSAQFKMVSVRSEKAIYAFYYPVSQRFFNIAFEFEAVGQCGSSL